MTPQDHADLLEQLANLQETVGYLQGEREEHRKRLENIEAFLKAVKLRMAQGKF